MPDLQGLVSDARFQALSPEQKRAVLARVGVDVNDVVSDEPGGGWDQSRADRAALPTATTGEGVNPEIGVGMLKGVGRFLMGGAKGLRGLVPGVGGELEGQADIDAALANESGREEQGGKLAATLAQMGAGGATPRLLAALAGLARGGRAAAAAAPVAAEAAPAAAEAATGAGPAVADAAMDLARHIPGVQGLKTAASVAKAVKAILQQAGGKGAAPAAEAAAPAAAAPTATAATAIPEAWMGAASAEAPVAAATAARAASAASAAEAAAGRAGLQSAIEKAAKSTIVPGAKAGFKSADEMVARIRELGKQLSPQQVVEALRQWHGIPTKEGREAVRMVLGG